MKYSLVLLCLFILNCNNPIKYPEGGFAYPEHIADDDTNFYFYPLKDSMSEREAFFEGYKYLSYQFFNEPNLSIKPQPEETFRFTYSDLFESDIIILREDSLIVKKGNPISVYTRDTSHLSAIEKLHLEVLETNFPLQDTSKKSPRRKRYLDSMITLYSNLLDAAYYHKLYDKTIVQNQKQYGYQVTKIQLSTYQYSSFIRHLTASGFWRLPYFIKCGNLHKIANSFTLEANTKTKYKMVEAISCANDTTSFTEVCQNLLDMAGLDKKLTWREK